MIRKMFELDLLSVSNGAIQDVHAQYGSSQFSSSLYWPKQMFYTNPALEGR